MPIIPCSDELMGQAESLVRSVFRWMTAIERFSFIAIRHPNSIAGRLLMCLAGVKDKVAFDVYVDEANQVLVVCQLYFDDEDGSLYGSSSSGFIRHCNADVLLGEDDQQASFPMRAVWSPHEVWQAFIAQVGVVYANHSLPARRP